MIQQIVEGLEQFILVLHTRTEKGLWPIPALGIGYGDTKIIEVYDFVKAIVEDTDVYPNFDDGYQICVISDAILESAEKGEWVKVNKL